MKRAMETDEQPKSVKKLILGDKDKSAKPADPPAFTAKSNQTLAVFGDQGLMVSHVQGVKFENRDKWVPRKLNSWWERQKEVFIKWFYVFALEIHTPSMKPGDTS